MSTPPEELANHLLRLAHSRCELNHPRLHQSMIRVGEDGDFGPPCDSCMEEIRKEYEIKLGTAHGGELSPSKASTLRKRLGID